MSSHISKIFENSESEDESEFNESDFDEDGYVEESESDYETEEENKEENEEKETKKNKKVNKNLSEQRENAKHLIHKMFEKYNIASKNRDVKIKEMEALIYSKSKEKNNYNDLLRRVINNCNNLSYIQLKNSITSYFECGIFNKCKDQDQKNLKNITCRLEPMAGIHKCKCGCDKVYSYELQTRSADEGMTVFLQCYECGKKWRS